MISEHNLDQILAEFSSADISASSLDYILTIVLEQIQYKKEEIQLEIILNWLRSWLQNVKHLPWNIGHRILHLMSTIVIYCNCFRSLEDIFWILNRINEANDDVDVQNRGDLIKSLMCTLSQEKLKQTFLQATDLNETAAGVGEISLSITTSRKIPISVTKEPHYSTSTFCPESNCDAKTYLKFVEDVESRQKTVFKLKVEMANSNEQDLQALVLIPAVATNFGTFEPVLIGHLKVEDKICTAFMNCYLKESYPFICNLRAEFSIHNRLMTSDLPPLQLKFTDYFRHLPVSAPQRTALFPELCTLILNKGGLKSCYILPVKSEQIKDKLEKELTPFIVTKIDDGEDELIWFAIYLPPCKHLLLKFAISPLLTKVIIITNDTQTLTSAHIYLEGLS
uniref:AP5B1 C-terminal domain-containing protein n=1 Tax=Clastoptera arizonana TaxID=38151 RepID=A0A1B6EEC1_9HEMI